MNDDREERRSISDMTPDEQIAEILRIVRGLADTAVEHDARLLFIKAAVDMNAEDTTGLSGRVRHIETAVGDTKRAVDDLTKIVEGQQKHIAEHDKTIHELHDEERQRRASVSDR